MKMVRLRKRRQPVWLDMYVSDEMPIKAELFSTDRLEHLAETLAQTHEVGVGPGGRKLMSRVFENAQALLDAYEAISHAVSERRAITPAAEWLLDNFHVVEEQVNDISEQLPVAYYRELPKLTNGSLAGYPRVYGIAWALVAHTDSRLVPEQLGRFVHAYQRLRPLSIGELWAIPITLRVVMVENLRRLAVIILRSQMGRSLADKFIDQFEQSSVQTDGSSQPLAAAVLPSVPLRQAFSVQIIQRLHEPHPGAASSLAFLHAWLAEQGVSLDEVVNREHADQTAANLTVRNAITSMRAIAAFDWPTFVEDVSLVDACLRRHQHYGAMDFLTRDRYRHAIEELGRQSKFSELEIADKVMHKLQSANVDANTDKWRNEPGYYLIGPGRSELESDIGFRASLKQRVLRAFIARAAPAYIGAIGLLTLLLLALPLRASIVAGLGWWEVLLFALFGAAPATDIAVGLVNRFIAAGIPPRYLPRLELKDGVPSALRTFVVVPTMLASKADAQRQVDQLEIHYLANPDGDVRFAILSDWGDADRESLPGDGELLSTAATAIAALNVKHSTNEEQRFFLFHRKRIWNPSEEKWMGWERKRGKLHEFNRLLRGAIDTSFTPINGLSAVAPRDVRYVITLDADTQLPLGTVCQLVGAAAHPLNCPVFDPKAKRVVEGYGLLQPRVTSTLPQRLERSAFLRLISGSGGYDPYARAVSDVYQDLFGHGIYMGKGLYNVDAFEAALAGRVPENTQLSHDLFESVFARCALVSDIELFEEFPARSSVAASRSHRWARGDWQLLRWIFGPSGQDMPLIGRWHMLDNLRRSLSAPGNFFTLVVSWAIPVAPTMTWLGFVLASLALPVLLTVVAEAWPQRRGLPLLDYLRALRSDVVAGVASAVLALVLLVQNAWLMVDAILRTLVRLFITRRKLLMWVTAAQAKATTDGAFKEVQGPLFNATVLLTAVSAILLTFNPTGMLTAAPFLVVWWLAPFCARALSSPPVENPSETLPLEERMRLRSIGRQTWRFFTTFVTAQENHLPPDNYQETPRPIIAHRSSPTNFGLYLLSVITARDFGWLGVIDTVDRLEATLETLMVLPRQQGHFFNWYDTRNLSPLEPRYVSTVDSGNLAGHLLTLAQACREAARQTFSPHIALQGLADAQTLLFAAVNEIAEDRRTLTVTLAELRHSVAEFGQLLGSNPPDPRGWSLLWGQLERDSEALLDLARAYADERGDSDRNEVLAWATLLRMDVCSHKRDIDDLFPWIHFMQSIDPPQEPNVSRRAWAALRTTLSFDIGIADAAKHYGFALEHLRQLREQPGSAVEIDALATALRGAEKNAVRTTARLVALAAQAQSLFDTMDFRFLYDSKCHLFSLGYRVVEGTLDSSYYDLLASEARLTSFIAIAKRDVPSKHWFHLGRRVTRTAHGMVLLSWSGSMFEYLMPSLVAYTPRYSMLDQSCRLAVKRQIEYGRERGVPWGVSESAFNMRDRAFTYQYSDFGVPGLGMKRGLRQDLVIAPYATALGAMYEARAAMANFSRLRSLGALGPYGFFEALDFTPTRLAEGQQVAVVRCFMAHHQGMSVIALGNVLHDGMMRHRFHRVPIIQAAQLLLQERIPHGVNTSSPPTIQVHAEVQELVQPPVHRLASATTAVPSTHVLSNGNYAVMLTGAGSGYSVWNKLAVTRWREDVTRDCWGSYIYLRDVVSGKVWSAGYQPVAGMPEDYQVHFVEDRARITRTDGTISTALEVIVSPEDNAEIRRVSLTNKGRSVCDIEITSYMEVVLAPLSADVAHPAFSNLFVQTEYLPQVRGLIAWRRPRAPTDTRAWVAHVLAASNPVTGLEYETDRVRFLGRGGPLHAPIAVMDGRPLTNTVGAVLDPILSLRTRVRVAAGATVHVAFATMVAATREAVEALADKYHDPAAFDRISALAWTHAQVQLHHLRIKPDEAQLFQCLANRLIYADPSMRPASEVMLRNAMNVSGLWQHRISGDNPIVLLQVTEPEECAIVEQLLRAHEYWRMKQLAVDLVIMNDKGTSYVQDLQTRLEGMVRDNQAVAAHEKHEQSGTIYVLRADALTPEHRLLLNTAARAVLKGSQGTLAEQVLRRSGPDNGFIPRRPAGLPQVVSLLSVPPALEFFNGLGGFNEDGGEYVIVLDHGQWTPAPWINVVANPEFGFLVSESGSGCTWSLNSRENQLTPWSNDPVSDPPGEVFYLRDDETGALWGPTALPIRVGGAQYLIRHGQGYSCFEHTSHGIASELLQFVAADEPVKLSRLTLTNLSSRQRRITVAAYVEWVLGATRTVTAPYIVTELDVDTGAVFASNPWNLDFGRRIAFADFAGGHSAWTGSRTEFIGRNGDLSAPAGLIAPHMLTNRGGAGLDPCSALLRQVDLQPNERVEIVFFLGQGQDRAHAQELVRRHRTAAVQVAFAAVQQVWEPIRTKVQVKTPDRALDIMLNHWLLYQTVACRLWGRAGFYQAGGAYGFRDQLQDGMALSLARPDLVRQHLLRAASRQFVAGDVQHWWHPPTGRGVRTHFSDDRLWLPYAVSQYLQVTGDVAVLEENVPFLEGPALEPDREDAQFEPLQSTETATLYEHCARAIDVSLRLGIHGLPLMGGGDWNDGMNRVGDKGRGESVWLAWFLFATLGKFGSIADTRGDALHATRWREHAAKLKVAVEAQGWDGAWYRRAYFDDGTPLGSATNAECRIDSIAQSWAVMSGGAEREHAQRAMQAVRECLIRYGDDLVLLFTPPFDKTALDPGYIKGYLPGIRENGGQYTHAAVWCVIAYAMLGDGDQAAEIMRMINPIHRTATRTGVHAYKVEPYVMPGDTYAEPPHVRRGGWTWYTGAAGWLYRAALEWVLGLRVSPGVLHVDPCIPTSWRSYSLCYRDEDTRYEISVENPTGVTRGVIQLELDGYPQAVEAGVPLLRDGKVHQVRVVLGTLPHS